MTDYKKERDSMHEHTNEYVDVILHVPTPLEQKLGLWVRSAGHNLAKPTYHVGPRMLNYYSIHIVKEGHLWFRTGQEEYELQRGDLFCMIPGTIYEYGISNVVKPLRLQWLAIDGTKVNNLFDQLLHNSTNQAVHRDVSQRIPYLFEQVFTHLKQKNVRNELKIFSVLFDAFSELMQQNERSETKNIDLHQPLWLEKSISFMSMHYKEDLSVKQVAEWLGMSRTHFSQYFTKHKSISPSRYIESLRIHEAKNLLQEQHLSITEIALSVGFQDLYSFSRAFKRRTGMTPTKYRLRYHDSITNE